MQAQVFAELVAYIENDFEEGTYIFKLAKLHSLYEQCLSVSGVKKEINKSRLKEQLISHFIPECQEQTDGKHTLLVFNEGLQKILKGTLAVCDFDEAISISCAVSSFSGAFALKYQENSAPHSL